MGGMTGTERREKRRKTARTAKPEKKGTRGPADTEGKRYTQGELDELALKALRSGKTQAELARELGIADNSMMMAKAWRYAEIEFLRPPPKPRNWTGKSNGQRVCELQAERRRDTYNELVDVQYRFSRMCVILEAIHVQDYLKRDVELWKITDMYDDLISLGEWHTRQLSAVQGYLDDFEVVSRIEKLRNVAGRTPEEAETALRLADKLEKALNNRLA